MSEAHHIFVWEDEEGYLHVNFTEPQDVNRRLLSIEYYGDDRPTLFDDNGSEIGVDN